MGRGNITRKNNSFQQFQTEIPNGTKKKINVGVSEGYTTLISEDDNVKSKQISIITTNKKMGCCWKYYNNH